jgi:hypothetical protein
MEMFNPPIRAKLSARIALSPSSCRRRRRPRALACRASPCSNFSIAGTGFPPTWRYASNTPIGARRNRDCAIS